MGMKRDKACQDALAVFIQYGYRKTSMEDVARAIGVSRQWVYQQFQSKERLFGEVVEQAMKDTLERALANLNVEDADPPARLLGAFDGWCGEYLDSVGASPHADELFDSAVSMHGERIQEVRNRFEKALTKTIKGIAPGLPNDVPAKDTAMVLMHTSDAIKHSCENRKDYLNKMAQTIRVVLSGRIGEA